MPADGVSLGPSIRLSPPGPRSRALAARLQRVECPDTTYFADDFPIFWERAEGANVWDVDGNRYVDLTGAFGVAAPGHATSHVTEALRVQAARLVHGMGDVHPSELKVQVAERLAAVAPGDLDVTLFGNSGFEAVEAAIKTATLATGRPGVVAFEGAYHGLGYGALAVTWREDFRAPFARQLNPHVAHVAFPNPHRKPGPDGGAEAAARALEEVDALLGGSGRDRFGSVLVEPIQGRAGVIMPHATFLPGLREICSRRDALLIGDEILTGLGRTGRWFACEHADVVPDLLCVGKALGGGLPLSACVGTPDVMAAWGRSSGEARHTSTFLGNPLACAAAVATLDTLRDENWPERVAAAGADLGERLHQLTEIPGVVDVRGVGFLWGAELRGAQGRPDAARAFAIVRAAMRRGVLLLADGTERNVLSFTPPYVLSDEQRDAALGVLRGAILETAPA